MRRPLTVVLAAACLLGGTLAGTGPAEAAATAVTGTAETGGTALNLRAGATAGSRLTGAVPNGGTLRLTCYVYGETIAGTVRTSRAWDRLTSGSYVSDAYVRRSVSLPACSSPEPAATAGAYMLPVASGIISGFRTAARPTHDGVDLSAVRNTPIHAAAAGRVVTVTCNVSSGTCDVDGSPALRGCGWYVEIQHGDGYVTRYCHLVRRPSVTVGQSVVEGEVIGYVGTSGSSSGPHLHFEVHTGAPAIRANAIDPVAFMRAKGLTFGE